LRLGIGTAAVMAFDLSQDIRDRTFKQACDVARLAMRVSGNPGPRRIADPLLRAATSVGANLEEAKAASSRRDFIHCVQVSLKESRETLYWLRLCAALQLVPADSVRASISEADQVTRILGAIVVNTKRRQAAGYAVFAFCILNFALLISG
jgi:four helix bundle protein